MKLQFLVYRILHYFPPKTIYFLNACHLGWWSWPPWPPGPPWSPTPPGPPGLHRPPGPPCPPGHSIHPNHSDHLDHMGHLAHLDQMVHLSSTFRSPSVCLSQTWHLNFSWWFYGWDHKLHVFSECISSGLIILTTWTFVIFPILTSPSSSPSSQVDVDFRKRALGFTILQLQERLTLCHRR